jgi:hypothetical protein
MEMLGIRPHEVARLVMVSWLFRTFGDTSCAGIVRENPYSIEFRVVSL